MLMNQIRNTVTSKIKLQETYPRGALQLDTSMMVSEDFELNNNI